MSEKAILENQLIIMQVLFELTSTTSLMQAELKDRIMITKTILKCLV